MRSELNKESGESVYSTGFEAWFRKGWATTDELFTAFLVSVFLAAINSATPFTVYDSANVSLQAPHPGVSGMFGDRPNVVSNPNKGAPHKISQWVSPSAFQRLDPIANAGQFGNEQRNSNDGPAYGTLDTSLSKNFPLSENTKLQFRADAFNLTNHVNLVLPVDDMNSPAFGQIIEAQSARVFQLALKIQR